MHNNIPLLIHDLCLEQVKGLSQQWGFELRNLNDDDAYAFEIVNDCLQLRDLKDLKFGVMCINFTSGKVAHRRIFGSARNEAIAKAVGWKKNVDWNVLDMTAGFGRDAFVLASIGCRVHMVERCAPVAALLEDGLRRAKLDTDIGLWVSERLTFSFQDSREGFSKLPFEVNTVYIDSMFERKKKLALVKKELQILRALVGFDQDDDDLLPIALNVAKNRVVVKRPAHSGHLADQKPNTSIGSKGYRFDIYLVK